tara:strand:+ start:1036 stop:2091 length:1056 start_codon:yes stop_codon:yes gene_type:complete
MNKFKKVGLTALAGSLAAVSANAIEMSVNGSTSVSYNTGSSDTATTNSYNGGQSIGVDTGIQFTGSGELENGFTVKSFAALDDGRANTLSSSQLTLGMGSLGTVVFAQQFGSAANGIDHMPPRVKEEAFDNAGGSVLQNFGRASAEGTVTYKSPSVDVGSGLAMTFGLDYDPQANVTSDDHDAVAANATTEGSAIGMVVAITSDLGLTIGAGRESIEGEGHYADKENTTAYALYSMGPVSVGYQAYYMDRGAINDIPLAGTTADYSGSAYSIAFNVNDQLSLGYEVIDEDKEAQSAILVGNREIKSITAAYTAGGMSVAIQNTQTENYKMTGTAANELDLENTQVTLSFAF